MVGQLAICRADNCIFWYGDTSEEKDHRFENGDDVDLWITPEHKDVTGWRGPAEVIRVKDGQAVVKWGGKPRELPAEMIRPGEEWQIRFSLAKILDEWPDKPPSKSLAVRSFLSLSAADSVSVCAQPPRPRML